MRNTSPFKLIWLFILVMATLLMTGATDIDRSVLNPQLAAPNQQISPILSLNPDTGSANARITAIGENWLPDTQITLLVLDGFIKYGVGGAIVDDTGRFEIDFFMPSHMRNRVSITVRARTVVGTADGAATVEAIFGNERAQDIDREQDVSQPVSTAATETTASPAMAMTPEEQAICEAQQNAANMSFAQATALPSSTVAAPVCNPSEWSGCGGASCSAEYVSQCQADGTWGECVWDPGYCGENNDDDDDDDDDDE